MPITIICPVEEVCPDGCRQWEVEQDGVRSYMTMAEIRSLMGA